MNKAIDYKLEVGRKYQNYFLLGKTTHTSLLPNSQELFIQSWKDAEMTYKVSRNDVSAVIPRISWNKGSQYTPWNPNSDVQNCYIYNRENGYVYLCISDNSNNRLDGYDTVSRFKPSHTTGEMSFSDGYSWLALYQITPSLEKFVTSAFIPAPSLDEFEVGIGGTTPWDRCNSFCNGAVGVSGTCAVYVNKEKEIPTSGSSYESYALGDLYTTIPDLTCRECYFLFQDEEDDDFVSVFYGDQEVKESIEILSKFDLVEKQIQTGQLSPNSVYYKLYSTWYNNGFEDGCVVSSFIDLSAETTSELIATQANPRLQIKSLTGYGAIIELITFINPNGNHQVCGIRVVSRGQNYKDISLSIDTSLLPGMDDHQDFINSKIEINLDPVDKLGLDPAKTLNSNSVMTSISLGKQELADASLILPREINFFSLVENPLKIGDVSSVAGKSTSSKYTKEIQSFLTTLKLVKSEFSGSDKERIEDTSNWLGVEVVENYSPISTIDIKNVSEDASCVYVRVSGDIKSEYSRINSIILPDLTYVTPEEVIIPTHVTQFTGTPRSSQIVSSRTTGYLENASINIITVQLI